MIDSSNAPAWIAAGSPLTPIHSAGSAIAARIEAMKMNERGVSDQGQRSVAQCADWKKPSASTSAPIPARQSPARIALISLSPRSRTRGKIPSVR